MIEELKYQQDQQVLHNQISNLETLKAQQVEDFFIHGFSIKENSLLSFRVKWKKDNVCN
jgi:hypothetical protein